MVWSICEAASERGLSVFLLGGDAGVAERAADIFRDRCPGLEIAGTMCPPVGFENDERELERIRLQVTEAAPRIVFVALGFPKQDLLIRILRSSLPTHRSSAWESASATPRGRLARAGLDLAWDWSGPTAYRKNPRAVSPAAISWMACLSECGSWPPPHATAFAVVDVERLELNSRRGNGKPPKAATS